MDSRFFTMPAAVAKSTDDKFPSANGCRGEFPVEFVVLFVEVVVEELLGSGEYGAACFGVGVAVPSAAGAVTFWSSVLLSFMARSSSPAAAPSFVFSFPCFSLFGVFFADDVSIAVPSPAICIGICCCEGDGVREQTVEGGEPDAFFLCLFTFGGVEVDSSAAASLARWWPRFRPLPDFVAEFRTGVVRRCCSCSSSALNFCGVPRSRCSVSNELGVRRGR